MSCDGLRWATTPEVEEILTPKQVTVYTKGLLKEATLAWWRHHGDKSLPFGRLGRKIVYRKSDVDAFIAAAFEDGKASA